MEDKEEEFQESDVVFSSSEYFSNQNHKPKLDKTNKKKKRKKHKPNKNHFSVPMNIPINNSDDQIRYVDVIKFDDLDDLDDDDDDGEERLPPHLIVARRVNNVRRGIACSLSIQDGKGRLLKGKNLCEVRKSILRLTGFYET